MFDKNFNQNLSNSIKSKTCILMSNDDFMIILSFTSDGSVSILGVKCLTFVEYSIIV